MSKSSRRSISVKGETYQRTKTLCEAQGWSVSGYLEALIAADLAEKAAAGWAGAGADAQPATDCVTCPECGAEQADMGRIVACEKCGHGPMPTGSDGGA